MLKYDTIKALDEQYVMPCYKRMDVLMVQGSGCTLWDNRGKEYLDLLAGIGAIQLGHCHPALVAAITRQAQQLIHVSNVLLTAPQAQLAKRLCELSGMEKVFYAVCGATSVETALKIAKKHGLRKIPDGDYEIVALVRSFHGRTIGAVSATGRPAYQEPFQPLVPGFKHIEANNIEALRAAVSGKTAAIILETVMGEGGVNDLSTEFLQEARRLCDENDALLILDEVQCGMGRTGKWFAYQHHDILPDVLCLAKGLGSGFPIGACLARGKARDVLGPGDHGATFGGNPLACAAAMAVIDTIDHQRLMDKAAKVGKYFTESLMQLPGVVRTSGMGLMIGVTLDQPVARDVVVKALDLGLIINATDDNALRFVPPLVLTEDQVDQAINILAECLGVPSPKPRRATVAAGRKLHDVLAVDDLDVATVEELLDLAAYDKQRRRTAPAVIEAIENRTVGMIFEKPSLRTRVSFETAIRELGGHPVYLTKNDIGLGSREAVKDIAGNLSRWCNMIVARLYWQKDLQLLADVADVPVVNALTEQEHPCQALADIMTVREAFGEDKVKIAYVGDGNNVARSLAKLAIKLGYEMTLVGPENFQLEPMEGLTQVTSLEEGLANAHVVYTDVWVSMGDEREQEQRLKVFESYQVDGRVMSMAAKDAIFLHCLPARRGYEVTDDVLDGFQSRVNDQAENRLHAQKALLRKILGL